MRQVLVQGSGKIYIAARTNDHRFRILKECLLIVPEFCRLAVWLCWVLCSDFTNWNQSIRKVSFLGFHSAGYGDPTTFKLIQIAGPVWFLMVVRLRFDSRAGCRLWSSGCPVPPHAFPGPSYSVSRRSPPHAPIFPDFFCHMFLIPAFSRLLRAHVIRLGPPNNLR